MRAARLVLWAVALAGCGGLMSSGGRIREQRDNSEGVTRLSLEKMELPTTSGITTISVSGSVITSVTDPKQVEIMKVNPNLVRVIFKFGRSGSSHEYFRGCQNVVFGADDKSIDSGSVDAVALVDDVVIALFPRAEFGQLADAQTVKLAVCGSQYDLAPEHLASFRALAAAAKKPITQP